MICPGSPNLTYEWRQIKVLWAWVCFYVTAYNSLKKSFIILPPLTLLLTKNQKSLDHISNVLLTLNDAVTQLAANDRAAFNDVFSMLLALCEGNHDMETFSMLLALCEGNHDMETFSMLLALCEGNHDMETFAMLLALCEGNHDMETFAMLLALCEGNPLVTSGFPSQRASNM